MSKCSSASDRPCAQRVITIALALALGACATQPIPKWTAPARTKPAETDTQATSTLAFGYLYANAARDSYRAALVDQLGQQTLLANGLVVTGALAAALALGGAHRDAIAGAAVIGGTGFALGNLGLSRPRLLVYLAGEEAINCAKRAVSPFDMPMNDLKDLTNALLKLAEWRLKTEDARRRVEEARAPFMRRNQTDLDIVKAAQAAIVAAAEVQRLAGDAYGAGRAFEAGARQAEVELMFAVDRIDASVVRAALDTVPDLSAVPRIIAGLAGTFDQFAPGAGVGARTTAGLTAAGANGTSMSGEAASVALPPEEEALLTATRGLIEATATLSERSIDVSARLTGRTASWNSDAFKECGVSDLAAALRVMPALLQFTLGAEPAPRSIIISGGAKPYVLEFEGPVPAGVTLRQPLPGERRAEVTVGKEVSVAQVLTLRVMDSSANLRMQSVTVNLGAPAPSVGNADSTTNTAVNATDAASTNAAGTVAAPAQPMKAAALVSAINANGLKSFKGLPAAMKLSEPAATDSGGQVTVRLRCPDALKAADRPSVAAVRQAVLAQVGATLVGSATLAPVARDATGASCLL